MSQGPISRKVTLPSGALGVVFEAGSTKIEVVREGSPLLGHVQPGERVVAFTREDGSMIECTGMSDAALAHELKQTVHQSGRIITVGNTETERDVEVEQLSAAHSALQSRVRELERQVTVTPAERDDLAKRLAEINRELGIDPPGPETCRRDKERGWRPTFG